MGEVQSVISGATVPKWLEGFGVVSGFRPAPLQGSRLVITGPPGCGKSTFLNGFPGLLMLDPEGGGNTVADPKAYRFTAPRTTAPKDLDEAYMYVVNQACNRRRSGNTDVSMIGIDTLDSMVDIFLTAFCLRNDIDDPISYNTNKTSGNGYTIVRKAIFGMLDRVYASGMGWAIITHMTTELVSVGERQVEKSRLTLSQSFRGRLMQACEHMLFMRRATISETRPGKPLKLKGGIEKPGKPVVKTHEVRQLMTQPGQVWDGASTNDVKVRVPLPGSIVIPERDGYQAFADAYDQAIRNLRDQRDEE